jgi:hypothetical protein
LSKTLIEQGAALEEHAELAPDAEERVLGQLRDVLAVDEDVPRLRADEAADQPQHRALARAAAAEDHGDAPRRERAGQVSEHRPIAKGHGDV